MRTTRFTKQSDQLPFLLRKSRGENLGISFSTKLLLFSIVSIVFKTASKSGGPGPRPERPQILSLTYLPVKGEKANIGGS